MNEQEIELLCDLHVRNHRQGPGSDETTKRAIELTGIDQNARLEIADIGCGTGVGSIALAQHFENSVVTAVDFAPMFLEALEQHAQEAGVQDRIQTLQADMGSLPFTEGQFDLIWSEGAIYNIGFQHGIDEWRRFLKPGGVMVLTEITWLQDDVPAELRQQWESEYPEIDTASAKLRQLEDAGYEPIDYFALPPDAWIEGYYVPAEAGFDEFLARHDNSELATQIVEAEKAERALYETYKDYYSYGCYIARRNDE